MGGDSTLDTGAFDLTIQRGLNVMVEEQYTKTGSGTLTLAGTNAAAGTGATIIAAGTLRLNQAADVIALAANVTVADGATLLLSSSGQVADTVNVTLSGGTIRRDGAVSATFGDLNLSTDSFLDYGTGAVGTLRFGLYSPEAPAHMLTVANFSAGNRLQFGNSLSGEQLNSFFTFDNAFVTGMDGGFFTITAIPEPSTVVATAGLAVLLLGPTLRRLSRRRGI
jgi:autotransporter-associated beta strand protein